MTDSHTDSTFLVCVSDQEESEVALRYACERAKLRNAQVAILHVVEPADFQGLISVEDVIQQEKEEEAQELLNRMADIAIQCGVQLPTLILQEGDIDEAIIRTTLENSDINMVILGVRHDSLRGPKIASRLTDKMGADMLVPLMLVPGGLTDEQINRLL